MRITCLGAARTVTGSSYLVEMDDDSCFLVDCGMFQGSRQLERRNWNNSGYRPKDLGGIFITHAHIDHSGLVPRLVKEGYSGPVYASKPTCELLKILWLDSAHIQEMESQWQSRKNKRQGREGFDPLYDADDAQQAITLLHPVEMDCYESLVPGVSACFLGAGHILGATSLYLTLKGKKGEHRVGFSGDLGRPGQLIVPDPEQMLRPNTLFMETTYGSRRHKDLPSSQAELIQVVKDAYAEGGKVIIPAFAVERTQEIIFTLAKAWRNGELPQDMPVFLDSPLAINATLIFREHPEYFDDDTKAILAEGDRPLNFPSLKFTTTTEESRGINDYMGPAVIIAGSGMANAGRIKHHLKHNLWRPNCHVVIVGYQAKDTTGRLLVEGADKVKIFREDVAVRAHVHTIGGFSAHADQEELLEWLGNIAYPGLRVNLTHGEEDSALAFKRVAQARFPKVLFHIPRWHEDITLAELPVERVVPAPEVLTRRMQDIRSRLDQALAADAASLPPERALALEEALAAAEKALAAAGGE